MDWKKGHSLYICCNRGSLPASMYFCRARPFPSHTGRSSRVCVQAKIQGIARSVSMPPYARRLAGRLPMFLSSFWKSWKLYDTPKP